MNRYTVLSAGALERVASGALSNFAGSNLFEVTVKRSPVGVAHLLFAPEDDKVDSLIIVRNTDSNGFLPRPLQGARAAACHRILSLAQRTKHLPVNIPRGWGPYRHDDKVALYALPMSTDAVGSYRWVAQLRIGDTLDLAFWELTSAENQAAIQHFTEPADHAALLRKLWEDHLRESLIALQGDPSNTSADVEVVLDQSMPRFGLSKSRTLSEWIPHLTVSQREFVEADTSRSIRLRGPAGSGKTLTMAIKAVRQAQLAKDLNNDTRILFATHSWSLAGEVDEVIHGLSEYGSLDNIVVLPLVALAQELLPVGMATEGLQLIGDDSLTGKSLQLEQIREVVAEFKHTDWITFEDATSPEFRARFSSNDDLVQRGLIWDLLIEFGCVLGADGIFPGFNAETRYLQLPRAPWMMVLPNDGDKRTVYALYELFWTALEERGLITSDQLLNDFLNYLETFSWNHRRRQEGYDLIFVDEFHLFNTQERQTLRYLSRKTEEYPRIFMSLDPRQSPWEVHIGVGDVRVGVGQDDDMEDVRTVDIPTVHRLTPQVLGLVKHVHLDFPNLDLGADWAVSINDVESLAQAGPKPSVFVAPTQSDEEMEVYKGILELYPSGHVGAQLAVAIVDEDMFPRYGRLMEQVSTSGRFRIVPITNREDVGLLSSQKRGVVVGPAEYLAGLQFDTVLIAGLPDMNTTFANQSYRRRRSLSLLYLALTRASREVRIFVNDENGGVPKVLGRAQEQGLVGIFRSSAQKSH